MLEISATPYIFTFKMYDWLRMGLDGVPRALNIERAFQNLYFDRQGERIQREFISRPSLLSQGTAGTAWWRVIHLPTHANHFYDVHRLEFNENIEVDTLDSVMSSAWSRGSVFALKLQTEHTLPLIMRKLSSSQPAPVIIV